MLFNSFSFLFAFLPITLLGYFYFFKGKRKLWIVLSSFFFYSYWDWQYLPVFLVSIIFNFWLASRIIDKVIESPTKVRRLSIFGVGVNLLGLIYYKYSYFIVENVSLLVDGEIMFEKLVLPLAISFFTFQQIAFLIDARKGEISKMPSFLDFSLFVSFFPQLIAGPIVHHREMMPQFENEINGRINFDNISRGLYVLTLGLFKKVIIADTFAKVASLGFDQTSTLSFLESWVTSLSYTFQLYFDFSGYTNMAIGVALMFNIVLPLNFMSPYKSASIQDFWRRWHMTLSRFLRDYIYIPLGGNRKGERRIYINLFLTFLIGGIWHGAGWTFVAWGALHGFGLILHRIWNKLGGKMNKVLGVFLTFNFVNIAWVFFRAKTWDDAIKVLKGMFGMSEIILPEQIRSYFSWIGDWVKWDIWYLPNIEGNIWDFVLLFIGAVLVFFWKNVSEFSERFKPSGLTLLVTVILFFISVLSMNQVSEFLYFQF